MSSALTAQPDPSQTATSLRDLLFVLFKFKWVIILTMLAAVLGVMLHIWLREDLHEVSAKVLVRKGREIAPPPAVISQSPLIMSQKAEDINSEMQILHSRELVEEVVAALRLDQPRPPPSPTSLMGKLKQNLRQAKRQVTEALGEVLVGLGLKERLTRRESAIQDLYEGLQVVTVRESNVILVKLRLPFKSGASVVLNKLLELYQQRHLEAYKNAGVAEFFDVQVAQFVQQLQESERALEEFKASHAVASLGEQQKLLLERVDRGSQAIAATQADQAELESRCQALEQRLKDETPRQPTEEIVRRNPALDLLRQRVFDLQQRRLELLQKFASDSPQVSAVEEQIKQVQAVLAAEEVSHRASSTTDVNQVHLMLRKDLLASQVALEALKRKFLSIKADHQQNEKELAALRDLERQHNELARATKVAEGDYLFYKKKAEEARASDALDRQGISNITIIEAATDPILPVGMRKAYLVLISLAVALVVSLGLAFLLEYLDHSVYFPEQVEAATGARSLATVNFARALRWTPRHAPHLEAARGEDYLGVLIDLGARPATTARCLVVTASGHGEGVTTTVLNLAAVARQRLGWRVLAVEMNQSRPAFAGCLRCSEDGGVQAVHGAGLAPAEAVQRPACADFDVLPFGTESPVLAGPHLAQAARRICAELGAAYDLILFDVPPVNASGDAVVLTGIAEGALFVVEFKRTRREVLRRAAGRLRNHDLPPLVGLLNKRRHLIPNWLYKRL